MSSSDLPPLPSVDAIYGRAWRDLKERMGVLLAATAVMVGVGLVAYFVVILITFGIMFSFRGNQLASQVGQNLVGGVFGIVFLWGYIGYVRYVLEAARGAEPQLQTLFTQHRLLPNYFLSNSVVQVLVMGFYLLLGGLVAPIVYVLIKQEQEIAAAVVAVVLFLALIVAISPLFISSTLSMMLVIDRELDPISALVLGLRAIRGNLRWCYWFSLLSFGVTIAGIIFGALTCYLGFMVVMPFMILVSSHLYFALIERLEAAGELAPLSSKDAPGALAEAGGDSPDPEHTDPEHSEPETTVPEQAPADTTSSADTALAIGSPLSADSSREEPSPEKLPAEGSTAESPPQATAASARRTFHAEKPSPWVTVVAIAFLTPWILTGGNPVSGGVIGFFAARQFGFPDAIGVVAGTGLLLFCGLAAWVALVIGYRGRRDAALDAEGFAVDLTPYWNGFRLPWHELRAFRITGDGVQLFPTGLLGYVWRPVIPSRERDTHDVVEALEAKGILSR